MTFSCLHRSAKPAGRLDKLEAEMGQGGSAGFQLILRRSMTTGRAADWPALFQYRMLKVATILAAAVRLRDRSWVISRRVTSGGYRELSERHNDSRMFRTILACFRCELLRTNKASPSRIPPISDVSVRRNWSASPDCCDMSSEEVFAMSLSMNLATVCSAFVVRWSAARRLAESVVTALRSLPERQPHFVSTRPELRSRQTLRSG